MGEINRSTSYHPVSKTPPLEDAEALTITFNDGLTSLIVWRDKPNPLKVVGEVKRLRDLQAGDRVLYRGEELVVRSVEVFR